MQILALRMGNHFIRCRFSALHTTAELPRRIPVLAFTTRPVDITTATSGQLSPAGELMFHFLGLVSRRSQATEALCVSRSPGIPSDHRVCSSCHPKSLTTSLIQTISID